MRVLDLISGLAWLFLSLFAMLESYRLDIGSFQKPGSGFMPGLAACALGFFSAIICIQALLLRKRDEEEVWPNRRGWTNVALLLMLLTGYALSLELVGFLLGTFCLLVLLLKIIVPQSWAKSIVFSLLASLFSYLLFDAWLKVPLPPGLLSITP
jgi:putative tricarboxylic transport membrane protein